MLTTTSMPMQAASLYCDNCPQTGRVTHEDVQQKGPAGSRSLFIKQCNLAEEQNAFRRRRLFAILNHRTIEELVVFEIDIEERRSLHIEC